MTRILSEQLRPTRDPLISLTLGNGPKAGADGQQRMPMNMLFYGQPVRGRDLGGSHSLEQA